MQHRGSNGNVALGGIVVGSPLVQGAVAQGQSSVTVDGAAFNGVVRPGDTFTVAGDAQVYTVATGGAVGTTTPNEIDLTFSPTVQVAGGWADNAVVSFVSNSMAEIREWEGTFERPWIEGTVMGDGADKGGLDVPGGQGRVVAIFDYGDAKQKDFVDDVLSNTDLAAVALALVVAPGKQFWGDCKPTSAAVTGQKGAYFEVTFGWQSEGAWDKNWN